MSEESPLSERETEVLEHLVAGASNNQIASELHISPNTVKVHIRNIYSKLGVLSRTEATTEALRRGFIIMPGVNEPSVATAPELINEAAASTPTTTIASQDTSPVQDQPQPAQIVLPRWLAWSSLGLVVVLLGFITVLLVQQPDQVQPPPTPISAPESTLQNFWEPFPPLPQPTAGAAGIYAEDTIYVVGGSTPTGTTNAVWRFQPARGVWEALAVKPTAVSGISAGIIGDQMYVPGGIGATGERLRSLEIYDLSTNTWRTGPALPAPRSDYGLATIEGELYVFGGHDADGPVDSTLMYNPTTETWNEGTALPIALSDAALAQKDERQVYLMGGITTGGQANLRTWRYLNGVWEEREALPDERINARAVFVTDRLYLIGGNPTSEPVLLFLGNTWKPEDVQTNELLAQHVLISDQRRVYILGGWNGIAIQDATYSWDPIVTIFLPNVKR